MLNREDSKTQVAAMGCGLMIIMLPLIMMFRGFVLTCLWQWFVVPFGLPTIGLWHAYGLSVLVGLFAGFSSRSDKDEEKEIPYQVFKMGVYGFGLPTIMLFLGWICYCLM